MTPPRTHARTHRNDFHRTNSEIRHGPTASTVCSVPGWCQEYDWPGRKKDALKRPCASQSEDLITQAMVSRKLEFLQGSNARKGENVKAQHPGGNLSPRKRLTVRSLYSTYGDEPILGGTTP